MSAMVKVTVTVIALGSADMSMVHCSSHTLSPLNGTH